MCRQCHRDLGSGAPALPTALSHVFAPPAAAALSDPLTGALSLGVRVIENGPQSSPCLVGTRRTCASECCLLLTSAEAESLKGEKEQESDGGRVAEKQAPLCPSLPPLCPSRCPVPSPRPPASRIRCPSVPFQSAAGCWAQGRLRKPCGQVGSASAS